MFFINLKIDKCWDFVVHIKQYNYNTLTQSVAKNRSQELNTIEGLDLRTLFTEVLEMISGKSFGRQNICQIKMVVKILRYQYRQISRWNFFKK